MKLSTYIYLIIHIISLFLPIIHLVEVSHAHNHEKHETQKYIENTSKSTQCSDYKFNIDLDKWFLFLNQSLKIIDVPKQVNFWKEICFEKITFILLPKGQDPPFKNTYTNLVGIIKIQIFDVI